MASFVADAEKAPSDGAYHANTDADGLQTAGTYGMYYRSGRTARQGLYGYGIANSTQTGYDIYSWALKSRACIQAPGAANTFRSRQYFRYDVLPTGPVPIINGSNYQYDVVLGWAVVLNANGTLSVKNGAGTVVFTSTFVTQVNTWYRLEVNYAPANAATGATSKFLLVCGPDTATFVATNSSTQAYYYSTTFQMAASTNTVIPGIGSHIFGKCDTTSWKADVEWDDIAGDNNTFSNTPSTWIGKALTIASAVLPVSATAGFTAGGYRQTNDGVISRANSSLAIAGDMPKVAAMSAGASSSLVVGPTQQTVVATVLKAASALLTLSGSLNRSVAWSIVASSTLTVGGSASRTTSLVVSASSSALYGAVRSQNSVVGVTAQGTLLIDTTGLWQAPVTMTASGLLTVGASHSLPYVWTPAAIASLAVAVSRSVSSVIAVRGTPTLTIGPSISHLPSWAVAGVGSLIVAGSKSNVPAVVPLTALAQLGILVALVTQQPHGPDAGLAVVLGDPSVLAIIKSPGAFADLLEMGRIATVLDSGLREAIVLPAGVLAVVQD